MKGGRAGAIRAGNSRVSRANSRGKEDDILSKYGLEMIQSKKTMTIQNSVEPSIEPCL